MTYLLIIHSGGTSGCVLAGRLAEDLNVSVLVVEAGADNAELESTHMAGGCVMPKRDRRDCALTNG